MFWRIEYGEGKGWINLQKTRRIKIRRTDDEDILIIETITGREFVVRRFEGDAECRSYGVRTEATVIASHCNSLPAKKVTYLSDHNFGYYDAADVLIYYLVESRDNPGNYAIFALSDNGEEIEVSQVEAPRHNAEERLANLLDTIQRYCSGEGGNRRRMV